MPGTTVTFRPIEANLTHNTDLVGKMNPYCAFIVGDNISKGQICKKGGKHPHWDDAVTVPLGNQNQVIVEIMDKDRFSRDDNIGSFLINLNELSQSGQSSRWYPLTYKNKPAGEILLETTFAGGNYNEASTLNRGFYEEGQSVTQKEQVIEQPAPVQQEVVTEQRQQNLEHRGSTFIQEQQQFIEPRTFLKEVDVVETRAHVENIEVLEPRRVTRQVTYTQAVPVTKQIEIIEPRVVLKEVEVMEPRLVTKTIQVIENVPVRKQVEVIENVPRMQEVQTFESQTFTKQVEMTDYVPVQHSVTVTEPVHLKKNVEFVEPVIHTKTITKEIAQPVIIDEKITTTVGPASVVAESETYTQEFSRLNISQNDRLFRFNEWRRLRNDGYDDQRLEQHFVNQGWGPLSQYRFNEWTQHNGSWGLWNNYGNKSGNYYGSGSQYGSQSFGSQSQQFGSRSGSQSSQLQGGK